MSFPQHSGISARNWRRRLAGRAERCDDAIRTLKFPLDSAPVEWEKVRDLHQVIAGDGKGSLIRFLYTLLGAGFRVFGKQAATEAFRNDATLDDKGWLADLSDSPLTVAKEAFKPSAIYQRILVTPRAVAGKNTDFTPDLVATEWSKAFCAGKSGDKIPQAEAEFFFQVGEALCAEFDSWKAVSSDPDAAAAVVDAVLKNIGYPISKRSLAQRIGALRPAEPAGTVAFDPTSVKICDAEGIEPNLIVARAIAAARESGLTDKKDHIRFVQEFFTGDANHGGLAWLFGKGLVSYFKKVDIESCLADFDVPVHRSADVVAVLVAAGEIPDAGTAFLSGKNYAVWRSGIGGTLGGWISNYIARLYDLDSTLSVEAAPLALPAELLADEDLLAQVGILPSELADMAQTALYARAGAKEALGRLLGQGAPASRSDVDCIEAYNSLLDTLAGLVAAIHEKVKKEIDIAAAEDDAQRVEYLKSYAFDTPKWIRRLDKLNRLDLAPIDPQSVLDKAAADFQLLHSAMHDHFRNIQAWASQTGETLAPLTRLAAREAGWKRGEGKRNAEEYAFRACMDMIGRAARKCSDATLHDVVEFFRAQHVFIEPSHLNQYFYNRRGMLYKSPFDKNPRQPFPITRESFARGGEILEAYGTFLTSMRARIMGDGQALTHREVSDLYRLERGHFAMLMTGFPEQLPVHLALLPAVADVFNLPLPVKLRLQGDKVSSSVMRSIFNHYYIQLERLVALLLRDSFFVRAKFQRAGDNALIYAPVGGDPWNPPARLYETTKPIGDAMRQLEAACDGRHPIEVPSAVEFFVKNSETVDAGSMRAFLRQAPHDWRFAWPGGEEALGVAFSKDDGFGKRLATAPSCRLVGAPSYKGVLDQMVVEPELVSLGDAGVLVDQYFTQKTTHAGNGRLTVAVEPTQAVVNLALPVKVSRPQKEEPTFTRYVAIDLGERGIGYAVFDAETHTRIDAGIVKIKSIRRLAMDDKVGKRKKSEATKFRAAYDPAEQRRRENVVGDFCHAINRLMWYYDAFPVLEYAAGGASRAIDKVYAEVAEHYLYSTTPTVDATRKSYWTGAGYWKHPKLTQYKFDKSTGKKGRAIEALSLFPGVGESAYGTSQTCSCCGRNPVEEVRRFQASQAGKSKAVFEIKAGGVVKLERGAIKLHLAAPEVDRAEYRARKERVPLTGELAARQILGDDLIRLVNRNLRQAPQSRQSRDTSQSRYQCLYMDCGKTEHAEINAAINLGKKFAQNRPQ